MLSALYVLRGVQCLPNGIGGVIMSLDCVHGQVRRDFVSKFGFPPWFPTALGLFKLTQLALNWIAGGQYVHVSQALFALQLGGAAFTHMVVEKPNPGIKGVLPVLVFFSTSVVVQTLNKKIGGLAMVLVIHLALSACGFIAGYGMLALGSGSSAAVAMSPVKWGRKRGFD